MPRPPVRVAQADAQGSGVESSKVSSRKCAASEGLHGAVTEKATEEVTTAAPEEARSLADQASLPAPALAPPTTLTAPPPSPPRTEELITVGQTKLGKSSSSRKVRLTLQTLQPEVDGAEDAEDAEEPNSSSKSASRDLFGTARAMMFVKRTMSWLGGEPTEGGWTNGGESTLQPRKLTTHMPPELLRGVSAEVALRGFGAHFAREGGAACCLTADQAASTHLLSQPVDHIDDFVSHDWVTGRWPKFVALCVVHNGMSAVVSSSLAGLGIGVVEAFYLPENMFRLNYESLIGNEVHNWHSACLCMICCPIIFLVVFLFGQRLRWLMHLSRRKLFVDRLCIHQTDAQKKGLAILGLAAFLKRSQRLVVLWSPRYLTRLWCVYEVASWIALKGHRRGQMLLVPVSLALTLLLALGTAVVFLAVMTVAEALAQEAQFPLLVVVALVAVFSASLPIAGLTNSYRDMQLLREQLESFSVDLTECFCCCHGHVNPETGDELPCDRELIFETLQAWFQEPVRSESQEDMLADSEELPEATEDGCRHLRTFSQYVRLTFRPHVLTAGAGPAIRYRDALMAATPALWYRCDCIPLLPQLSSGPAVRYVGEVILMWLVQAPCFLNIAWRLASLTRGPHAHRSCMLDAATAVLRGTLAILALLALWYPTFLTRSYYDIHSQIGTTLAIVAVCVGLFHPGLYLAVLRCLCRRLMAPCSTLRTA